VSDNFVKIYNSILDSRVWLEDYPTKIVWITLLAMAHEDGIVRASVGGVAHRACVTREECEAALEKFMSPDEDSKSKDHEGRRIKQVDGGWYILNHQKYRDLRTKTQIQTAERVRKWREGNSVTSNAGNGTKQPLTPEAEAEAEAEVNNKRVKFIKPTLEEVTAYCFERKNEVYPPKFIDYYESNGWKVGRNPRKSWKAAVITWESNHNGSHKDTRSRVKRVSDKLDEIARRDIEQNGHTDKLG